jgi:hypothetical protein
MRATRDLHDNCLWAYSIAGLTDDERRALDHVASHWSGNEQVTKSAVSAAEAAIARAVLLFRQTTKDADDRFRAVAVAAGWPADALTRDRARTLRKTFDETGSVPAPGRKARKLLGLEQ